MKNNIIVVFVVLISSTISFAQKSFIGQTNKEIKDYWLKKTSPKYFDEGFWDDSGDAYFTVMTRKEGRPDFEATFKRATAKCSSHSQRIKPDELNVYKTKLKNLGFKYDAPKNIWTKEGVSYTWKIQQYYGGEYVLLCEEAK